MGELCLQDPRGDLSLVDVVVRTTSVEPLRDSALEEGIAGTDRDLEAAVRGAIPVARAALQDHTFEPLRERAANVNCLSRTVPHDRNRTQPVFRFR